MALFSKPKNAIGLDIGSSSVKVLELEQSKAGTWRLLTFDMARLPPEAIVDGAVMNVTAVVDAIRGLIAKNRIKTREVVASVSAPTGLGVSLLERLNITLIAFCRPPRASIFTHPERIIA